MEDANDDSKMADLLAYFQQQLSFQESALKLCQPEYDATQTHISELPMEVLMYVFRWVVSSELDLRSLEQLSLVCKGFYICSSQLNLLLFHNYYRYMRFFPDGQIIMLTTPEEPQTIVPRLRTKNPRLLCTYFIKIYIVYIPELKPTEYQKYRYFRRAPVQETDHSFHVGLQLCSSGRQKFNKLVWIHHSCHINYKSTGETAITSFDMDKMYTPLFFARVKSYTAVSERPL
ncbi:hypothetical protein AB205_0189600 [Aquarana catesbeiana]|uniref:F-box domain-containing protein n=1 Tax=Aquarana catesbeiana TaxID=8400 RepID=A0A2G9RMX7_AQUCT|nr:hypothetical protein AB205_0189600 [Aquarana catesbeiana]